MASKRVNSMLKAFCSRYWINERVAQLLCNGTLDFQWIEFTLASGFVVSVSSFYFTGLVEVESEIGKRRRGEQ
ncbi:unnamed protein product [Caenorhabditis brenneri]